MTKLFSPADILIINGPNLNLLGQREPHIYGSKTLDDINESLKQQAESAALTIAFFQSNHEGALIDAIHLARNTTQGLIINPGGFGHTSVALRDALTAYSHPAIEVHLSNIYKREGFRHHSYLSAVVTGVICGLGATGYTLALKTLIETIRS